MMENAVYSVISPEGCAAILWKDAAKASDAAACLRLTANDLKAFGLVDEIIPEPESWSVGSNDDKTEDKKRDSYKTIGDSLRSVIVRNLNELRKLPLEELTRERFKKYRKMGSWV